MNLPHTHSRWVETQRVLRLIIGVSCILLFILSFPLHYVQAANQPTITEHHTVSNHSTGPQKPPAANLSKNLPRGRWNITE